jgi:hypothetical protein
VRPGPARRGPLPEREGALASGPLPAGVEVHFANDALFIGTWECVQINVWCGPQRLAYARPRGECTALLASARGGPIALLTIVRENAGLPDEAAREALAQLRTMQAASRVVACAGLADGPPLRQAAARAVSIDLDQRVPPPFPTRMFGKRLDAVLWVVEALRAAGASVDGRVLLGVVAALCDA